MISTHTAYLLANTIDKKIMTHLKDFPITKDNVHYWRTYLRTIKTTMILLDEVIMDIPVE